MALTAPVPHLQAPVPDLRGLGRSAMLGAALSMPSTRTAGNVEGLTTHHSVSSPQYCASYRGVRASPPPLSRLCMPQRPQGPKRQPPGPFGPCRGLAFRVMSRVDGIARATERESGGEVLSRDSHMVLPRPSRLTGASCPWATTPPPTPLGVRELESWSSWLDDPAMDIPGWLQ